MAVDFFFLPGARNAGQAENRVCVFKRLIRPALCFTDGVAVGEGHMRRLKRTA